MSSFTIFNTVQVIDTYPFSSAWNFDCSCWNSHKHKDSADAAAELELGGMDQHRNSRSSTFCNGVGSRHTDCRADASSPIQPPSPEFFIRPGGPRSLLAVCGAQLYANSGFQLLPEVADNEQWYTNRNGHRKNFIPCAKNLPNHVKTPFNQRI
jgi:hypothetical protein